MKFGLAFASSIAHHHDDSLELCRAAEAAGFESLWGGEHVILPTTIESPYPYTADGKIPARARDADPRPADLVGVRRSSRPDAAARHVHPDRAPAQPAGAGQGTRDPRPTVGRPRRTRSRCRLAPRGVRCARGPVGATGCPQRRVRGGDARPVGRPARRVPRRVRRLRAGDLQPSTDPGVDPHPRGRRHRRGDLAGGSNRRRVLPRGGRRRTARVRW